MNVVLQRSVAMQIEIRKPIIGATVISLLGGLLIAGFWFVWSKYQAVPDVFPETGISRFWFDVVGLPIFLFPWVLYHTEPGNWLFSPVTGSRAVMANFVIGVFGVIYFGLIYFIGAMLFIVGIITSFAVSAVVQIILLWMSER